MLFKNQESSRSLSQTDQAYNYLFEKILCCEYLPGQEISEKMLNEELSFGRTPIREALVTLKSQNLLTVYPRRGMQIRPFTKKYINEIYQIRKLIEPNVIPRFKDSYSKSAILRLQDELEACKDGDDVSFYKKDVQFHMYFIEMTGHDTLIAFYENIMIETFRLAMYAAKKKCSSKEYNIPQHAKIIQALMTENDAQIASAVNEHINYSLITLFRVLDDPGSTDSPL